MLRFAAYGIDAGCARDAPQLSRGQLDDHMRRFLR